MSGAAATMKAMIDPWNLAPGFYKARLVKGGWEVPVRVYLDDGLYSCEVDGDLVLSSFDPARLDDMLKELPPGEETHPLMRLRLIGTVIDQTDYDYRTALRKWAREHEPFHPCLHARKPISTLGSPAVTFPTPPRRI